MVTILLQQILDLLKGFVGDFTTWAADVFEKLGLIQEQTENLDDILVDTNNISANTNRIVSSNEFIKLNAIQINNKLTTIQTNSTTIANNSGSIATSAGTAAAFAEDCATNGLNILDKVTTIASDTTQMRADNAVVKSDLDKIYDAIRWSLINVLMTETESGSSPLLFDTDKADLINDLVCNIVATETGSGTKSPSNPYTISSISNLTVDVNGSTFTFALGQTVYGGYFDVTTGKLIITHKLGSLAIGATSWHEDPNRAGVFYGSLPTTYGRRNGSDITACSCFNATNPSATTTQDLYISGKPSYSGSSIFFRNSAWTGKTSAEINTLLTSEEFVYELATPIESTLTAQALTALIGLNTISSNGNGEISVTYTESVKHYLDKQEA